MTKHLLHIPSGEALVQVATIQHAARIDVQAVSLQMYRPIYCGWLTTLDSINQGFRAC